MNDFEILYGIPFIVDGHLLGTTIRIVKCNGFYMVVTELDKKIRYHQVEESELFHILKDYKINLLRKERRRLLEEKKITLLTHYTDISSLESILNKGLLSPYERRKKQEYELLKDYIYTNITTPDYGLLRKRTKKNPNEIILTIDSSILVHNLNTMFFTHHHTNKDISLSLPYSVGYFKSNESLEELFTGDRQGKEDNEPTSNMAEVLIGRKINITYINGIHTQGEITNEKILSLVQKRNISLYPNSSLFNDNK